MLYIKREINKQCESSLVQRYTRTYNFECLAIWLKKYMCGSNLAIFSVTSVR